MEFENEDTFVWFLRGRLGDSLRLLVAALSWCAKHYAEDVSNCDKKVVKIGHKELVIVFLISNCAGISAFRHVSGAVHSDVFGSQRKVEELA